MTWFNVRTEPYDQPEEPHIPCSCIALEIEEDIGAPDDGSGRITKFHVVHELGIDEAYQLASDLIDAANRRREIEAAKQARGEGHFMFSRGPYVLSLAKKRSPVEDADKVRDRMDALRKHIMKTLNNGPTGPTCTLYSPDRMRAWAVQLPDDPEVQKLFTGIMLDNLGGVSILTPGPAQLELAEGSFYLLGSGYGASYATQGHGPIRIELRPIVPIGPAAEPPK